MYNRKLNEAMAQIILRHKLANKEQIQNCLTEVTENRDIGMVMVMNGYLKQAHYQQIRNYVLARQQSQISTENSSSKVQADMDTRPVVPRSRPQVAAPQPSVPVTPVTPVTKAAPSTPHPAPFAPQVAAAPQPAPFAPQVAAAPQPASAPQAASAAPPPPAAPPPIATEKAHKEHVAPEKSQTLPKDFREIAGRSR